MARYIADLTELASSTFASGDFVEVWHAAGGSNRSKKLRLDRFLTKSGGNTIDDTQNFTGTVGFTGTTRLDAIDNGTSIGRTLLIERNNNGSTPAPGAIAIRRANNSYATVWVDNSLLLRIDAITGVTNAQMGGGTVVGTQTSSLDSKDIAGDPDEARLWARISQGAAAVRRFVYKSGAFDNEEFSGVVVDYAPHYGMDRDAAHPAGKSLNEINILGDLLLAVSQLGARVAALEAK